MVGIRKEIITVICWRKLLMKKSLLAGIIVSIAAYNYVANYDVLAKIVFSVALIVIIAMQLKLFTGKVGTIACSDASVSSKLKELGIILIGNVIACVILGYGFSFMGDNHASKIWEVKMQLPFYAIVFKSIITGFLMEFAVTCKKDLATVGAVLLFIGTGSEHSIANVLYMSVARDFSLQSMVFIGIVLIGNSIGAIIIHLLNREHRKNLVA